MYIEPRISLLLNPLPSHKLCKKKKSKEIELRRYASRSPWYLLKCVVVHIWFLETQIEFSLCIKQFWERSHKYFWMAGVLSHSTIHFYYN